MKTRTILFYATRSRPLIGGLPLSIKLWAGSRLTNDTSSKSSHAERHRESTGSSARAPPLLRHNKNKAADQHTLDTHTQRLLSAGKGSFFFKVYFFVVVILINRFCCRFLTGLGCECDFQPRLCARAEHAALPPDFVSHISQAEV